MTTAEGILRRLQGLGVRIAAEGGSLQVKFNREIECEVEPILGELREHKAEVLTELTREHSLTFRVEPDVVDLVPQFFHRDQVLLHEQLRAHLAEGLTGDLALHAAAEDVLRGRPILRALYMTALRWETQVVPTGRGDHAWSWIHAHAVHSSAIRAAEAEMDRIANKGDPQELQRACDAWVGAWRVSVEEWRRNG